MTSATALPLTPADLACQQAGDAQRYRALLHELMDMGMGMARTVHEQATAENRDPAAAHEAAAAFDLLSRAVRRTVAMARHVAQPLPQQRERAPQRTVRHMENVFQRPDSDLGLDGALDFDAETAKAFRAELSERLDRAELDDETGRLPIEEIIASIYRDLDLDRFLGGPPRPPGAGPAPGLPRPAPGPGEPWPEPEALPTAPPRGAGADAGPYMSDAECVGQMGSVLDEAGHPLAFKPRDG